MFYKSLYDTKIIPIRHLHDASQPPMFVVDQYMYMKKKKDAKMSIEELSRHADRECPRS